MSSATERRFALAAGALALALAVPVLAQDKKEGEDRPVTPGMIQTCPELKDATGRKADITFDRNYLLDLGGVRVRFLVVGPTHTRFNFGA